MKSTPKPDLPDYTKAFTKLTEDAQNLWVTLRTWMENKEEVNVLTSRGNGIAAAMKTYLDCNERLAKIAEEKEAAREILFRACVKSQVGKIETENGYALLTPVTSEQMDKEYLRMVAPEGFAVVPDGFRLTVKQ
jgi:hypothetical protein